MTVFGEKTIICFKSSSTQVEDKYACLLASSPVPSIHQEYVSGATQRVASVGLSDSGVDFLSALKVDRNFLSLHQFCDPVWHFILFKEEYLATDLTSWSKLLLHTSFNRALSLFL